MATPFSTVIERFYRRIEEDKNFFDYYNLTDEQSMAIAEQRSIGLLYEAIEMIVLRTTPTVNFYDYDTILNQFNFDLNNTEILLISSFMYQQYLERTVAKLKEYNVNYTAENLRVFDPSNARSTFQSLYDDICNKNDILLDTYDSKDRDNNELLQIDFQKYDEDN